MTESANVFITPPLEGPPTGGTLYDARLMAALVSAGATVTRHGLEDGRRALAEGRPGGCWVDSLYLDEFAALARTRSPKPLGLLAHYLPSLVAGGDAWRPSDLTRSERGALEAASGIVVPSSWLAGVFESVGIAKSRIHVVEPGVVEDLPTRVVAPGRDPGPLTALVVGNVVPGKGIGPFLEALVKELGSVQAPFTLVIVGSLEQDAEYAAACRGVVRARPELEGTVVFASAFPPAEVLRAMARADVFVSASRMESYGMALSEARAIGVPILARRGGNARAHTEPAAGGELFDDDRALAAGLVRLSRDPTELERRQALAIRNVRRRGWKDAAREFLRATSSAP